MDLPRTPARVPLLPFSISQWLPSSPWHPPVPLCPVWAALGGFPVAPSVGTERGQGAREVPNPGAELWPPLAGVTPKLSLLPALLERFLCPSDYFCPLPELSSVRQRTRGAVGPIISWLGGHPFSSEMSRDSIARQGSRYCLRGGRKRKTGGPPLCLCVPSSPSCHPFPKDGEPSSPSPRAFAGRSNTPKANVSGSLIGTHPAGAGRPGCGGYPGTAWHRRGACQLRASWRAGLSTLPSPPPPVP